MLYLLRTWRKRQDKSCGSHGCMYQVQQPVWEKLQMPILISDFDKEEQKRQILNQHISLVPIEWEKAKINVLDTPGYFDFVGEVEEAVSAADAAVIVVSGKAGVAGRNRESMGTL